MKVLITGGAGFIGSHTAELFASSGHRVAIVDDFSSGKMSNLESVPDSVELFEIDIRDRRALAEACGGVEIILHLAAISSVERSIREPVLTHDVNTNGFLSMMEAAVENKVRRVILASSAAVYGDDPELPKTESSPVRPLSPYAWHKLTGEFYGRLYRDRRDLEFLALRYFNVYGPRQDPASPYSGVLSIFADRAGRDEPLTIFGGGAQTRDFIHVSDVAAVNLRAAEAVAPLPDIINVSSGRETSINDIAGLIRRLCGSVAPIENAPKREGDIDRSVAATGLLERTLGYVPSMDLEEGLASIVG